MKITVVSIGDFKRPFRNVRHHPQKQIEEMKRSLIMFGQTRPMVVDDDLTVLVGNGMLTAMEELGWTEAECYIYEGLTETRKKKLMLADNRVYDLGLTDMDAFDAILQELSGDIDIPGWDADLLKTLTASSDAVDAMISSYGSFSAQNIDSIARKSRDDSSCASSPEAPCGPAATAQTNASRVEPEPSADVGFEVNQIERYVICPKCRERICL